MAYRAAKYGASPLYQILADHWETFTGLYEERYQRWGGSLRRVVGNVIRRHLDCANPRTGFARLRCAECRHEVLLAFRCKCRGLCPSCQARRGAEWAEWFAEELAAPVTHHHLVFTIPKVLRAYFRYDRKLLGDLAAAAHRAVKKYVSLTTGPGITPAMVVAKHTSGEAARFHPHLHALLTGGGWDRDRRWHPLSTWHRTALTELFREEVFRFFRHRGLLSPERERLLRSWPHSGFDAYVGPPIHPQERATLKQVARYLLRAPVALSRLHYERETAHVTVDPEKPLQGEAVELDVMDFILRLTLHIPNPHERLLHYYGPYANASRLRRLPPHQPQDKQSERAPQPPAPEPPARRYRRMRWAQLIRLVWAHDPLACPRCGHSMRIIAFITEAPAIDRILQHVGYRHRDPPPPTYRPPPVPSPAPLG